MNILLTSVGRRSYLARYFREALNGAGRVIGANAVADTTGLMACNVAEVTPFAYDPQYIPALLDICRRHDVRLLFSLHDLEGPFIADARDQFEAIGTTPVVAERAFIDMALDKLQTVRFCLEHGLSAPATWMSVEDALTAVDAGEARFPLIIKPRWGFGSIGLQMVHDADQLRWGWSLVQSVIDRSWIIRAPGFEAGRALMIQQVIDGPEYGVDIINDLNHRHVATFVEHKFAMRAGETDAAEIVDDADLVAFGETLGCMGRHPGVLDADVIVSDGTTYVIELNPRFGGHYPFAHLAGANVPAAMIAWAKGEQADPSWLTAEVGVRGYKDLVPMRDDGAAGA